MNNNNNSAVRYLLYLDKADDSSDSYIYRVIDVLTPGLKSQGVCDVEIAKCLSIVFPDSVSNFRIVDGRIVLGWTDESIRAMEELNRNLPSIYTIVGASDEAAQRIPMNYDEEDEEPWDADLADEDRITNPPRSAINLVNASGSMKVSEDVFDNWELPEDTPGIGEPGFHWGM